MKIRYLSISLHEKLTSFFDFSYMYVYSARPPQNDYFKINLITLQETADDTDSETLSLKLKPSLSLLSRRRRFFKLATFPTDIDFWTCPGVVVGFARAVWCNIRGGCNHSRAFSFAEVHHFDGLRLGYEGIGRPGPATGVDRPRPVVTDARIWTKSRLRSQNPKLGLACPGCL